MNDFLESNGPHIIHISYLFAWIVTKDPKELLANGMINDLKMYNSN